MLSLSEPILPEIEIALCGILHIRNVHHLIPTTENESADEVHECKC